MTNSPKPAASTKNPKKSKFGHIIVKILGILVPAGLLYWIFVIKIPSQISYADIWATIESLSVWQNAALFVAGLLTILVYGWTSATVLPGLSLRNGVQSAVSGQLTSVVLPAPIDLVIRFSMYKSYGYGADKSTVAVILAGIARYFTVFAIPILGLGVLILAGQGTQKYWLWFLGGSAAFIAALFIMRSILSSRKSAQKVGRIAQKIVSFLLRLFRRPPKTNITKTVVDFGASSHGVAVDYFKSIAISNLAWGLSCYLALFFALRFCGITPDIMSAAYILLVTGCMLLLNAFPITPGGIGVTETILVAFVPLPTPAAQAAFASALFVYRIYTWLLPMPIGAGAYYSWKRKNKKVVL